jgi:hypothetical protein
LQNTCHRTLLIGKFTHQKVPCNGRGVIEIRTGYYFSHQISKLSESALRGIIETVSRVDSEQDLEQFNPEEYVRLFIHHGLALMCKRE